MSDVCKIKPAPGLLLPGVRFRTQQTAQAAAHLCYLLTSQLLVVSQCLISAGQCGTYLGECQRLNFVIRLAADAVDLAAVWRLGLKIRGLLP